MSATLDRVTSPLWLIGSRDRDSEQKLMRELGIGPLLAAILAQRGFQDPEKTHRFLHPNLDDLGDPRTLPDFEPGMRAILSARESQDLIFIHGDYDVDGVTSAAILHRFLKNIGCNIHTHVPHRAREGYGIHMDAVDRAKELGAKLFLTCDCGIAAHEQVKKARSLGMKVIVTDHHEIAESIPEAEAVINPHRVDSQYPESELCGAGIVFRVCEGITRELNLPIGAYRRAFLDLACLGTVADVMPLLGENRIITKFGLEQLAQTKKVGIQALMREANVGQEPGRPVLASNIGWHLGPRLNAVGRIEDSATALKLLIEYDRDAADALAKQLEAVNTDRRDRTFAIVEQAEQMVLENGYDQSGMIVVGAPHWHAGIVGIVAGRLVEKFCRPCLVLNIDEEKGFCKGSARSIPNFHLAEAIWAFPELLSGGGHAMAAGCSFALENLDEVRAALDKFAKSKLQPDDLVPKLFADLEIDGSDLSASNIEELELLAPFGCGNPEPVFYSNSVMLSDLQPTRNPAHVRFKVEGPNSIRYSGIGFNIADSLSAVDPSRALDVLFRPEINDFRGRKELQWQLRHVRQS